jgi:hypothetical protein
VKLSGIHHFDHKGSEWGSQFIRSSVLLALALILSSDAKGQVRYIRKASLKSAATANGAKSMTMGRAWINLVISAVIFACGLFSAPLSVVAQASKGTLILQGKGNPTHIGPQAEWFLDTNRHRIYRLSMDVGKDRDWERLNTLPVDTLFECNGYAIYHTQNGYYIHRARTDLFEFDGCACGDSLLWVWNEFYLANYDVRDPELHLDFSNVYPCWDSASGLDTVLEQPVFCIARSLAAIAPVDCSRLRTWGMIDVNGNWRVEPKFDEPFHFKSGIAEVLYYGQKRKINENGEFVE